ncbi:MAG: 50S ribosomal protein L33 [Bacilli bacterium]|nr:50S ribosomal protein L33 [Bacilli bacterium]
MAKNENRNFVTMKCTVCGNEIRPTSKNKKNTPDRLEVKKYCKNCKKTTVAKEKK